ncbi:hypothetical protein [Candidatus Avelusimicrobium fimicolum]|uniref:hypothetical protein n=1 Tax=Candidatus Avelusimicrobium fimicolum TaxID=3416216 RepID=UPI003D0DA9A5
MANDNEVKFTAKVDDNASSAFEKIAETNEELAASVEKAAGAFDELESAQQNASGTADEAAQANENLSGANQETANSAENAAQAAEQEAQAKDKAAKSAENLAEKQEKAAGGSNILQSALSRLKEGFALDVVIGNLITKGIDLAISAFKNLADAVVDCVYKFADAEMISARLEASLRNQGITSSYVAEDLNKYAQSLQDVYGVSADVVKNGMRLLVNFGVLGDELKHATDSAYALSQGLGIDLQSAFQMVARAAEGNVTALSRYGIKVDTSKSQSEQFAQALEQIDGKFGQLAGSSANNLITKTNVLKETWGDFQNQVGAAFEPLGQLIVNVLTKGVHGLQIAFRFCTDTLNILVESGVQGFNYVSLGILKTKETLQELSLKTLEFRNAIGLASDEAVATARANLEATRAEIGRKKEQIELFRQSTQYLESERDAIAANSAASRAAAEEQTQAAKDRLQAEQEAEEARKKAAEEAKRQAEQDARDAENREKRVSDFKFNTRMEYLNQVAEIERAQTGYEQAEIVTRNEQDYQAKRTALENQIAYLAENNANDINAKIELQEQLKVLDEEYAAYQKTLQDEQEQGKISFNALDKFLADERTKNAMNSLNYISQLQNAKNKEMAAVGKAAAIATATVDTYKAANAAYSAMAGIPIVGPALGAAAAAAAIATGLMNVGKIVGVQFAVGTPNIPQDMVATVHRGEMVVPKTFAEGLRDGDLMLGNTENLFNETKNSAQEVIVENHFNFNGDVLADSTDSIAEKLGQKMSESIAGGRMLPFPTGERM